ncbi:hypothetical protein [Streptantibioticus cattleyicolor]|uniref:Integral membrane protein n=1 Tax=Streptantibioticus cattleyicolor (strain ATCC 35852 / DSM 46488 / JCM 4925 / NBRC 14057 / NRRL 8057) TaxID=1003195 RepID=F8K3J7_STREN|nr:hypothetical protein [Streptomyces sp. SID5468]AEW96317.1 integral membrane protein [Streptantibioticus cattleyicolor NRRL 8057 = DSM 46488]MYS60831.1 hypothetical protein [Streptomyces sp. SID5468]CCB76655.1 putative integral membrane protein [Streptantibioticus cattleyicolor NRRL 8057 = DSM 46488]
MATIESSQPSPGPGGGVHAPGRAAVPGRHLRTDRWWLAPAATVAALTAFVAYSTWRAFAGADYYAAPYVSPFYSPCLAHDCVPMKGGADWPLFGPWWSISPALIVLIFPLGFRLTCYYYRKAYYRGFWASPPACAVAEPHAKYTGETRLPLILQNLHRYFFYFAVLVAGVLTYDAVLAFRDPGGAWGHMGLGTLVLLANIALIWAYTLSCHSCRHIVGGRLRTFSKHPVRYRMWTAVSRLNAHHMALAWASLVSVAVADFYVYLVAGGTFADPRFF